MAYLGSVIIYNIYRPRETQGQMANETDVIIGHSLIGGDLSKPVAADMNYVVYYYFTMAFYNGKWLIYFYDPSQGESTCLA